MVLALVILLASSVIATNSTAPPSQNQQTQQRQGWTPEPNCGSGTASIVWQCFTTIGLCVYVAYHSNVPPLHLSSTTALMRKLVIIIFGLLSPEMPAFTALTELTNARRLAKRLRVLGYEISLKQAFFITAGGIVIRGLHGVEPSLKPFDLYGSPVTVHSESIYTRKWAWIKIEDIADQEIIFFAENCPNDDVISDKSKQDSLAKLIALGQVLWTLIQIAARGQQGLVIALLQVATLGYISMAVFSYACWWHKPYDIGTPIVLNPLTALKDNKLQIDADRWMSTSSEMPQLRGPLRFMPLWTLKKLPQARRLLVSLYNDMFSQQIFPTVSSWTVLGILTIAFAAVHAVAWNYPFSTIVEAWFWHGFVIVCLVLGVYTAVIGELVRLKSWALTMNIKVHPILWPFGLFTTLYGLGRIYLIIECFISFRDAPSSIYQQIDWSAYFPHFGA